MDLITATWQVTWNGVTLLDFTECMSSEPRLPRAETGETILLVGAPFARQRSRGNVTTTLTFSRVKIFADAVDARDFLLAHSAALPPGVADARITTLEGAIYALAGARLLPIEPMIAEGCRFECSYSLIGGALTAVGATIGEGGDTLVDDDGARVTDDPAA